MKLLLDTTVLYWWMTGQKLASHAAEVIGNPANHVGVSAASVWELAIKSSKGKLTLDVDVVETLDIAGLDVLSFDLDAALAVRDMPHHHGDPFDRMIIAQAQLGGYTILTSDKVFADYDVETILV